jgi:hypothetical protein
MLLSKRELSLAGRAGGALQTRSENEPPNMMYRMLGSQSLHQQKILVKPYNCRFFSFDQVLSAAKRF